MRVRPSLLVTLALVLLLGLAGCSGKSTSSSTSPTKGATGAPGGSSGAPGGVGTGGKAMEVFRQNGTLTAGLNAGVSLTNGATPLDFSVANGSLMYLEMQWTSPAPFDLNVCLHGPKTPDTQGVPGCENTKDGGAPGMPDSPFHYTRAHPETGDWTASPTSGQGGAANAQYEIAVTIFHGATTVPSGYSAL